MNLLIKKWLPDECGPDGRTELRCYTWGHGRGFRALTIYLRTPFGPRYDLIICLYGFSSFKLWFSKWQQEDIDDYFRNTWSFPHRMRGIRAIRRT